MEKLTTEELRERVEKDGLEYSLLHLFGEEEIDTIEDIELKKFWKKGRKILKKINNKLSL